MVFDPWRRCRRAAHRTRDAASTIAVLSSFLVVLRRAERYTSILGGNSIRVVSQEDVRPIGTRLGDRSLEACISRGLLRTIILLLCFHLALHPDSVYPASFNLRIDGQIRRNKRNTGTLRLNNTVKNNFPSRKSLKKERGETSIARDYGISQTDTVVDATSRKTAD